MFVFRYLFWLAAKTLFSLRYRVTVEGLDQVRGLKGALVLPNHPGFTDPPLVLISLWRVLEPRPMLFASVFENPLVAWIPPLLNAVRVPNLGQHSTQARQEAQAAIDDVVAGLQRGENHILWAAGRLRQGNVEVLGGVRSVADILAKAPQSPVVLVRTRGLWGSCFGWARTAKAPKLVPTLLRGAGLLLANLLFLTPRRHVHITVQKVERNELPAPTREAINPYLEAWYNAPGPEEPVHVPYHFLFGAKSFEYPPPASGPEFDLDKVTDRTRAMVRQVVEEKLKRPLSAGDQDPATKLDDLGLDSLDRMEIALAVEQRSGFRSDQVPLTLGDLWALGHGAVTNAPPKPPPPAWFKNDAGGSVVLLADTLALAFVKRAMASPHEVAAADDMSGVLTCQRMWVGAQLMAKRFAALPAPNLGIMLPASVACDLAILATHLAGKLPVMMNWTTGPANLAHATQLTKLSHIVTSRRFVDRIGVRVPGAEYLFLEDLRADIGRLEKVVALLRTKLFPGRVAKATPAPSPSSPAVVLFTSGSEKAPKAVPLTHDNLLSNIRGVLETYDVDRHDAMLAFLPPFHSFGMTITTLMPLLTGVRVLHHPDPTDAAALAQKIAAYKPTIICGTPTFISYIYDRAEADVLKSLRLVVVGAEKSPPSLFERTAKLAPQATVFEGYGITECSPLVSANQPGATKLGSIGKPMPSVRLMLVDPETLQPLEGDARGMLLVNGPNVFPGYLGHDGPSPFHEIDGTRWYITGDLATINDEGFVHFAGRLKRFLKAGGEMISLPALEEPLAKRYPPTDKGPQVAVEGVEQDSGRHIVLFATQPITLAEANGLLHEAGFHGIMRLDEVRQVEQIPVLGTGKTDYKVLRAQILEALT